MEPYCEMGTRCFQIDLIKNTAECHAFDGSDRQVQTEVYVAAWSEYSFKIISLTRDQVNANTKLINIFKSLPRSLDDVRCQITYQSSFSKRSSDILRVQFCKSLGSHSRVVEQFEKMNSSPDSNMKPSGHLYRVCSACFHILPPGGASGGSLGQGSTKIAGEEINYGETGVQVETKRDAVPIKIMSFSTIPIDQSLIFFLLPVVHLLGKTIIFLVSSENVRIDRRCDASYGISVHIGTNVPSHRSTFSMDHVLLARHVDVTVVNFVAG